MLPLLVPPALLVLAPCQTRAPQQEPEEPVQVAVLESGLRVPCRPGVAAGDRVVATPYGRYEATLDPVERVEDASREALLLRRVRETDESAWLQRASERGLVAEIVRYAREQVTAEPSGDHDALLDELGAWGARLDPVPLKVAPEDRVAWLWQRLHRADVVDGALLTGKLAAEVPGAGAPFKRRISLVDLRKGLRSDNPALRRGAARLARRQFELDMKGNLAESSLADPFGTVRAESAASLAQLDRDQALGRWIVALWRAKELEQREHAAEHLGSYGNEQTVEALVLTLAAAQNQSSGHRGESAFLFAGRQVSIVQDFDVQVAQAAVIADPVVGVVTEGSVLQVRVMSTGTIQVVQQALHRLTGASPGPKPEDWVRWYEAEQEQESP